MTRLTTAQEAILAELIGDVAQLLERVESLMTKVDQAREGMRDAAFLLDSRVEPFKQQLAAQVEQTKAVAVKAFIHQTNVVALQEQEKQRQAMTDAARTILKGEVGVPLRDFAAYLRDLIDRANERWWFWFTHAGTAATTAIFTGWFMLHFFRR